MKTYLFTMALTACTFLACSTQSGKPVQVEQGVSAGLATLRHENYHDVRYNLAFSIPEKRTEPVSGEVEISVDVRKKQPVILDFRAAESQVHKVEINGKPAAYRVENEHIVIGRESVADGKNRIKVAFTPDDQSLNRRDEFLYTLLVPDRARTLFPCFDQPDMKSLFSLKLEVPIAWQAVSNGAVAKADTASRQGRKIISFKETEPLSTYLFSFVAGRLERVPFRRNGREISVYHRETNPEKTAQCPEIARQVFDALEWLEAYTGIAYPFAKYDLIILPGFQYGGMEHTGATLYNDRRMFLEKQPTLNEELSRSSLIAHETAHMWFGDYVTMKWFDDVWTKEVFANYFAAKIVEPLFPSVNHALNFMLSYIPPSYAEDRTSGSNPVKQPLDNLQDAGLVYGNIIYNKSPVVLDMLVRKIGEERFRKGIQQYLNTYAYGNATWEQLIGILDACTDDDLKSWSHIWINEKGMPVIETKLVNDSVVYTQYDTWKRGISWPQEIAAYRKGDTVIPNSDGKAYGYFKMKAGDEQAWMRVLHESGDEVLRGSILISLYENMLNQTITAESFINDMCAYIDKEQNPLLYSLILGNIRNCRRAYPIPVKALEETLWRIAETGKAPQRSLQAFRTYQAVAESPEAIRKLYTAWKEQKAPGAFTLSETDYTGLSYTLALYMPGQADAIVREQLGRITNPDRRQEYLFISPAVSPEAGRRDSLFNALLQAESRRIEPWAATALSYLNHKSRQKEAVRYIRPGLEVLQEVQRTGDIFFPTHWVRALLSGHTSAEARIEVDKFFAGHPDYPVMLGNKIKQQAYFLRTSSTLR